MNKSGKPEQNGEDPGGIEAGEGMVAAGAAVVPDDMLIADGTDDPVETDLAAARRSARLVGESHRLL